MYILHIVTSTNMHNYQKQLVLAYTSYWYTYLSETMTNNNCLLSWLYATDLLL